MYIFFTLATDLLLILNVLPIIRHITNNNVQFFYFTMTLMTPKLCRDTVIKQYRRFNYCTPRNHYTTTTHTYKLWVLFFRF